MKPLLLPNVINPFSDKFLTAWEQWQVFRKEFDNFWYKTGISQQMALKKLVDYSGGDEEKAILIIEQSIASEWTGFYNLRNTRNPNGKSEKQSTSESKPTESERLRKEATDELMRRNGEGEQSGDGTHLKAV